MGISVENFDPQKLKTMVWPVDTLKQKHKTSQTLSKNGGYAFCQQ